MPVDGVDDCVLIDIYIVDLNGAGRRALGRCGDEGRDFLRLEWVQGIVGPDAAIEKGREDYCV